MRRRIIYGLSIAAVAVLVPGCRVDVNAAASQAIQSVFNTAFGNVVAGVVNGLLPTPSPEP